MARTGKNSGELARKAWLPWLAVFAAIGFSVFAVNPEAEPAISKSDRYRLEVGQQNQLGGTSTSPSSRRRHQMSAGISFNSLRLSGSRFRLPSGFLELALGSGRARRPPPAQLDMTVLYAKTDPFGLEIARATWQNDADPIFIWEPPAAGLDVAGYSFALDATPDDSIDTTQTSWNVASDPMQRLAEGSHLFWVKAINTAGNAGNPISFEIRVDTTPPTINSYSPQPGSLLNSLMPAISANISEPHSGINPQDIILLINGQRAQTSFNPTTGALASSGSSYIEGANAIELRVADRAGNPRTPLVWSVTVDSTPPQGSVLINAGALMTTSIYATLNLAASDGRSGVVSMLLSNDLLVGYVGEPYAAVRELWRLNAVSGLQRVYVKFVDGAGNVSEPVFDEIELGLLAPDTVIVSGPAGVTQELAATFAFSCPEGECVFSYAFDHQDWSEWATQTLAAQAGLIFGNHYFKVKAAKETNGAAGIQPDEEDPTPAERTWIIGVEPPVILVPRGSPIKLWRLE